jgi:hypothetical protein
MPPSQRTSQPPTSHPRTPARRLRTLEIILEAYYEQAEVARTLTTNLPLTVKAHGNSSSSFSQAILQQPARTLGRQPLLIEIDLSFSVS